MFIKNIHTFIHTYTHTHIHTYIHTYTHTSLTVGQQYTVHSTLAHALPYIQFSRNVVNP